MITHTKSQSRNIVIRIILLLWIPDHPDKELTIKWALLTYLTITDDTTLSILSSFSSIILDLLGTAGKFWKGILKTMEIPWIKLNKINLQKKVKGEGNYLKIAVHAPCSGPNIIHYLLVVFQSFVVKDIY